MLLLLAEMFDSLISSAFRLSGAELGNRSQKVLISLFYRSNLGFYFIFHVAGFSVSQVWFLSQWHTTETFSWSKCFHAAQISLKNEVFFLIRYPSNVTLTIPYWDTDEMFKSLLCKIHFTVKRPKNRGKWLLHGVSIETCKWKFFYCLILRSRWQL